MSESLMTVEVAYALPEQQWLISLELPTPVTAKQAVQASGLLAEFPEIAAHQLNLGIFGAVCRLDTELKPGDRVEIYRPLIYDPKAARRLRAAK